MNTEVLLEVENNVATLTLNRPEAYNALSISCMQQLCRHLDDLDAREQIQVIIIRGSGRGFCAGHDLKEMRAMKSEAGYRRIFQLCSRLMLRMHQVRQPIIAAVHGVATAAGCQLVATADLAVADENSKFATPGVNIGLFCSTPMVALTRNIAAKHALEMLLLGQFVDARTALGFGLINRLVPVGKHHEVALEMARIMARKSPLVLKTGKQAFYRQMEMDRSMAYEYCAEVMTQNMLALDAEEGIDAYLEKRKPKWQGL